MASLRLVLALISLLQVLQQVLHQRVQVAGDVVRLLIRGRLMILKLRGSVSRLPTACTVLMLLRCL